MYLLLAAGCKYQPLILNELLPEVLCLYYLVYCGFSRNVVTDIICIEEYGG